MKNALIIAPHPDDETLGAGGTIKRLSENGWDVTVLTFAAHMPPLYSEEVHKTTVRESREAHAVLGVKTSVYLDKPAVFLGEIPVSELNSLILTEVEKAAPQILLIPYYDRHIDHRQIFDACMVAARPVGAGKNIGLVAAYETISETHWNAPHIEPNFTPNFCVDITSQIDAKLAAMECFKSQLHEFPGPRSIEALKALALFRGSQAGYGYAEAFHVIRMGAELIF
ncbi:MAG: PIG-L family deacetylase [Acidobacteria bacterium]|nr:PIG-L family deacetylase [Acidobacteriota bacterium]